jgi:DNA-binding LacI/PurR family transcriptional regulator
LLPGRRALCSELEIAPTTLEKAIKNLLADGTLRTETRRGTFVADTLPPSEAADDDEATSVRRMHTVSGYRIGIVDTVTNLSIMDPRHNWFEYMIVHAAEDRVSASGNRTVYLSARKPNSLGEICDGAAEEFHGIGVDAIIIVAYHDKKEAAERVLASAKALRIPAVVISTSSREWPVAHVWTDGRLAGKQAAEHLFDAGHRDIAFLAPFNKEWEALRIQGVLDAMRQAGLASDHLYIVRPDTMNEHSHLPYEQGSEAGRSLLRKAMESGKPFTAIIGANDWATVGAIEAMRDLGLTPGKDMALISFDDSLVARQHDISSVRFPLEQLGTEAADLALRAASGETAQHRLRIGCRVIARASSSRMVAVGTM